MSNSIQTKMRTEIEEIPSVLERQIDQGLDTYFAAGAHLREIGLRGFVTCARGTSDHAATFLKYLIETQTGYPVASIGPSVASVYRTRLKLDGFACLTFSQSGGSPDLVALQEAAHEGGAHTLAMLNVVNSPVGKAAQNVLPIHAGPEEAVAATKSYVGMLFASLGLLAGLKNDAALRQALTQLPTLAQQALDCDWSAATVPVARAKSVYCIGRGPGLAIAAEAALKFKETCRLHAEAYSAAEVLHGPVAIADSSLAALLFDSSSKAKSSIDASETKMKQQGTTLFRISSVNMDGRLPIPACTNSLLEPVVQAICFYGFVEDLSCKLGQNPDAPEGLLKVTKTL